MSLPKRRFSRKRASLSVLLKKKAQRERVFERVGGACSASPSSARRPTTVSRFRFRPPSTVFFQSDLDDGRCFGKSLWTRTFELSSWPDAFLDHSQKFNGSAQVRLAVFQPQTSATAHPLVRLAARQSEWTMVKVAFSFSSLCL